MKHLQHILAMAIMAGAISGCDPITSKAYHPEGAMHNARANRY